MRKKTLSIKKIFLITTNIKFIPIYSLSILFIISLMSGCASLPPAGGIIYPEPISVSDCILEQDELVFNEADEMLAEELSGLERTGDWITPSVTIGYEDKAKVGNYFPLTINRQVEFYLHLFQNRQRRSFEIWLSRSGKYKDFIRQELRKAGLPEDLLYLAMIESGFNPSAYSHAHASGLWQFLACTGREYGLRIDSWVDERRDPKKATIAAIAYLSRLYEIFDDWHLAVAAYNGGKGRIGRAVKRYNTRNFWEIAQKGTIPLETKRYVPRLIAAIMIAREPEKHGFTDIKYQLPVVYDIVKVPPRTSLKAAAVAAKVDLKTIRSLNNELSKDQTPPDLKQYQLRVPRGSSDLIVANLKRVHPIFTTGYKTHIVRKGDTIAGICRKYNINKKTLLKANNLRSSSLRTGVRLRIPYTTIRYVLLPQGVSPEEYYSRTGRRSHLVLHKLKRGDTLSRISRLYGVPVELIMEWNGIIDAHRIQAGQQIALYIDRGRTGKKQRYSVDKPAAGSGEIIILAAGKKRQISDKSVETQLTWYKVRSGDSLWDIARKFGVPTGSIRKWNHLKSNLIHPGKRLIIWEVL